MEELFDEEFLQGLDHLSLAVKRDMAGLLRGDRRSTKHGTSVEFADYRDYSPGDDIRYLDWNVYARIEKLLIKLFRDEEDLEIILMVDNSRSMMFGAPSKLLCAKRLAAAMGYIALSNSDRCVLSLFDSEGLRSLPALRGKGGIPNLFKLLKADHQPAQQTGLKQACAQAAAMSKCPGVAIVFSDFLVDEDYRDGLKRLRWKGHEVYVVHTLDSAELAPDLRGDVRVIDSETHDVRELSIGPRLLRSYKLALGRFLSDIERFCSSHGISYVRVATETPTREIILNSFIARGYLR